MQKQHDEANNVPSRCHKSTDSQGALQAFFLFCSEGRHRLQQGPTLMYGTASSQGKTHLRANSSWTENSVRLMAVLAADDEGADRRCSGPILTRNPRAEEDRVHYA